MMIRLQGRGLARSLCCFATAEEMVESFWETEPKVEQLAQMINKAKYPIFFTGAGISTSIGIPDYRSGSDTVLPTGPGLWNRPPQSERKPQETPIDQLVDLASPSLTHMFISTLLRKNIAKHLVSQNTDGLHLKSGVPLHSISQLHGNRNLEECVKCRRKYIRSFRTIRRDGKVYSPGQKREHFTGRYCQNCEGQLHDSIIYFGQKLPRDQLAKAYYHATQADLCICVGSSLTVKPSSLIPIQLLKNEGQICIINIQQTPLDPLAALKINYFCDDVFDLLAAKMGIAIDQLIFHSYLQLLLTETAGGKEVKITGKDKEGGNLSCFNEVEIVQGGKKAVCSQVLGHSSRVMLEGEGWTEEELEISIGHLGHEKVTFSMKPGEMKNQTVKVHCWKKERGDWEVNWS